LNSAIQGLARCLLAGENKNEKKLKKYLDKNERTGYLKTMTNEEAIQKLDSTIKEIAESYNFTIEYCDVLEKVTIKSKDKINFYDSFFWQTSESKESFFDELKSYFIRQGEENCRRW
jgi:hypothetical protein